MSAVRCVVTTVATVRPQGEHFEPQTCTLLVAVPPRADDVAPLFIRRESGAGTGSANPGSRRAAGIRSAQRLEAMPLRYGSGSGGSAGCWVFAGLAEQESRGHALMG
jgi:hypothetical protein